MKILCSLILTIFFCSCDKNEANAVQANNANPDGKLIQSYNVNDKWESNYIYKDDNTLKEIIFKEDGVVQCIESFKYENGKIVESLKQDSDGSNTTKKQFEYKGNLIVKQIEDVNGELLEISHFKYDNNNLLKKISTKGSNKGYEYSKITTIEKLAVNKIRVKREGVATHIITFDENETPQCEIPGYQPLVQIDNNGISGNILLTEIYPDEECTTTIKTDLDFDGDGKTILSSKITYKNKNLDEIQEIEYNY